mmetsp:Transcript_21999/g.52352  ORF Transcript_21999/g.52352 Transcript_21999/m.52352 type:complete len:233 (+) Transcript_21999:930-1628(+)
MDSSMASLADDPHVPATFAPWTFFANWTAMCPVPPAAPVTSTDGFVRLRILPTISSPPVAVNAETGNAVQSGIAVGTLKREDAGIVVTSRKATPYPQKQTGCPIGHSDSSIPEPSFSTTPTASQPRSPGWLAPVARSRGVGRSEARVPYPPAIWMMSDACTPAWVTRITASFAPTDSGTGTETIPVAVAKSVLRNRSGRTMILRYIFDAIVVVVAAVQVCCCGSSVSLNDTP